MKNLHLTPSLAIIALLFAPVTFAQRSPSAQSQPESAGNQNRAGSALAVGAENEEVTVLPEFSVTSTKTNEYVAAESVTGTRVATKLIDLPFTVNVITAEFLDDFAAFEFREQTGYTSNVVGYESISTGYSVRGIDATMQLRNGFRRIGLIDKASVERVEIIKGAAASIYGTVMPGGTVNIITKKPKTKPEQRIGFTVGSNNLYRGQASSTGPLGSSGKLFYRVDLAADTTDYDIIYKSKTQKTAVGSILWKIASSTSLFLEYEFLKRKEVSPGTIPARRVTTDDPYFVNARTYNRFDGIAREIFDFNAQGPNVYGNRSVHTVTATLEHRFNSVFSLRSSLNGFQRRYPRSETGAPDYEPVSHSFSLAVPRYRTFDEDGAAWQTDLLASWKTGPIAHKTLLTFDWQRQSVRTMRYDSLSGKTVTINGVARTYALALNGINELPDNYSITAPAGTIIPLPSGNVLVVRPDNNLARSVENPDYRFISYAEDPSMYYVFQDMDNRLDLYGLFLSERGTFWNDRMTFLAGIRYDQQKNDGHDFLVSTTNTRSTSEPSYQLGLNFRVLPDVTAYVNIARSFIPKFTSGFDIEGNIMDLPNETGDCWEFGFKASAFGGRLTFTAAHFDLSRNNVAREALRDDGSTYTMVTGKETSKGYEFDFNWAATNSLQFFGGYGYTIARIVNSDDAPCFEGEPTRRTPRNSFGLGAKYNVRAGFLKGLYATVGFKYSDKALASGAASRLINTKDGDIINKRLPNGILLAPQFAEGAVIPRNTLIPGTSLNYRFSVDDGRNSLWTDSYGIWEAGIGYRWRAPRRFNHKIQFNMTNIADKRYVYGSSGQAAGRGWTLTYDFIF